MPKPKRSVHPEVLQKIKDFEALRLFAYPDPASPLAKRTKKQKIKWGYSPAYILLEQAASRDPSLRNLSGNPWTCGYGSTKGVNINTQWTHQEALDHLDEDLDDAQVAVERLVKVTLNDFQYGALVSFVFNLGEGNFAGSTLLKRLNAGDYAGAAARFMDWTKARNQETGKLEVLNGLVTRRSVEKALFLRGQFVESNTTVPVEVVPDEQKVVSKDPGVAIPAVTTGAVSVLALGEAAAKLEPLAEFSDTIRSIFVGLTLLGVLVTLFLGMKKRKDAQKENV
jgi:lysozyme